MSIQHRITQSRKRANLKQKEVAKLTGLSTSTISQYESGKKVPSRHSSLLLANVLNVTPSYLIHGLESANLSQADLAGLNRMKELSPLDWELLTLFKQLSPKQKEANLAYIEYLVMKNSMA